jgi:cytochrome c
MKRISLAFLTFLCVGITMLNAQNINPLQGKRVLVFSKTAGFRHSSIPYCTKAIQDMAKANGFEVDTTENGARFNEENLKKYKVVIFNSTTGNVLTEPQQIAFERYIQAGGGFMGIHAAADTEYDWAWYGKLVGGYFTNHPGKNVSNVQSGKFIIKDKTHISTNFMPDSVIRKDEFYAFKNFNPDVKVLFTVDEKSYKEGTMGDFHPMAWYHEYDGGRAFYTNWGHTNETFSEEIALKHIWGGLQWAAGGLALDYSKVKSQLPPDENRFIRTVLAEKLDEPTELTVLDNGKVLFIQRKGLMKVFDPTKKTVKTVADLNVFTGNEYGLMGLNIDPKYNQNHWVYLFYSPHSGQPDTAQRLSRFVYDDVKDTLVMSSEKVILRVPVKRTGCCHTGGSIDWDAQGNLFLSTGDDTNPFNSDGYGPIDNKEGRSGWDARYTSSNTNDLRGKILRIKPLDDGTYEIPEGNLFPKGMAMARPEIYVMGNRNPYRISVDKRTGFLYWGEVGPDAGENSNKYGPRGHDEVNQARKAGYFGWPLFVADNKAYNQRDFKKDSTWAKFDPMKPINDSPHNTGLRELPPAQKAFIYYPYKESPEFGDIVGIGGRNAMAGPVYYAGDYDANSKVKFPSYLEGKFFAYDWMRDWINLVTMKPNGDFVSMERFMPNTKFSHPMDMMFAKDGSLYMLEYGQNWFAQNDDARLTRITFNAGNRVPEVMIVADKKVGSMPLKVVFSSQGTNDPDGDKLTYEWTFAKGLPKSNLPNPSFTFAKAGIYNPTLKVKDAAGNVTEKTVEIKVGNEVPKVDLAIKGNKSFYWNDNKIAYEVKVSDKEDGSLENKKIKDEDVQVNIDYLEGFDKTIIAQGHQANMSVSSGKRLIELSDCKSCHSVDQKSIGPNYKEIAKKYKGRGRQITALSDKIIKGGGGVWGEQPMAAHPQLKKEEVDEMVKYIMSLADDKKASQPVKGEYLTKDNGKAGTYMFSASYTDRGANKIGALTGSKTYTLRSAKIKANTYDSQKETMKYKVDGIGEVVIATTDKSYVSFNDIDLTNIGAFTIMATASDDRTSGGKIEIRLDSPTGQLLGTGDVDKGMPKPNKISIAPTAGFHNLYLVFTNPNNGGKPLFALMDITAEKDGGTGVSGSGK